MEYPYPLPTLLRCSPAAARPSEIASLSNPHKVCIFCQNTFPRTLPYPPQLNTKVNPNPNLNQILSFTFTFTTCPMGVATAEHALHALAGFYARYAS